MDSKQWVKKKVKWSTDKNFVNLVGKSLINKCKDFRMLPKHSAAQLNELNFFETETRNFFWSSTNSKKVTTYKTILPTVWTVVDFYIFFIHCWIKTWVIHISVTRNIHFFCLREKNEWEEKKLQLLLLLLLAFVYFFCKWPYFRSWLVVPWMMSRTSQEPHLEHRA